MQTIISSRELDRKTGQIKKAALNGPVFITEQGRPSHVLITIEAYRALSSDDARIAREEHDGRPRDACNSG